MLSGSDRDQMLNKNSMLSTFSGTKMFVFKLAPSNTCTVSSCFRQIKLKGAKLNLLTLIFIFFGFYAFLTI